MSVQCYFRYPRKSGASRARPGSSFRTLTALFPALVITIFASSLTLASSTKSEATPFPLQVKLSIDGQAVSNTEAGPVKIPSSDSRIQLKIDPSTNLPNVQGARLQYRLRELDSVWQEKQGWMAVGIRFQDSNRDSIQQPSVHANGKSTGWNGIPEKSTFTSNQLRVTIPQGAAFASVFINSAGPPASVGTFLVKGLRLTVSAGQRSLDLIQEPDSEALPGALGRNLKDWHRAGSHSSNATRLDLDWLTPPLTAFQIRDNSSTAHCEWISPRADIGFLNAGTELVLTWDEMYDIGLSEPLLLTYAALPPGLYHLDLQATDAFGSPISIHQSVAFSIPPPFWTRLWFWAFVSSSIIATLLGIRHRLTTNRFWAELAAANEARLIETERMRIARDIHDDLGARITQILLISTYAQNDRTTDVGQTIRQISSMAKDLVTALHETLWTVNPENDHLDAVSDFICQLTQTLCEAASIRYRVHAASLPAACSITSSLRHQIVLSVKEAVNNAIKHGDASQLTLNISLIEDMLVISVRDNGRGFDPKTVPLGQGLKNMNHRMKTIKGRCQITSEESGGTQISFSIPLPS